MTTKKILAVYFSQTGQLENVVSSFLKPFTKDPSFQVDCYKIKPKKEYTFPWTSKTFFEEFPESVLEIPCEIEESNIPTQDYDFIILAYQPWFLSVSRPMNAFLQCGAAKKLLKNKPVLTLIACRNMWTQSQLMIEQRLNNLGAHLVGNIALCDRAYNLVSFYTILRWMFKGKKGNSGVSQADIEHTAVFGEYVKTSLLENRPIHQRDLNKLGAVEINSGLRLLEKRGIKLFRIFAKFVLKKGEHGDKKRAGRILLFKTCLFIGLVILSPISAFGAWIYSKIFDRLAPNEA